MGEKENNRNKAAGITLIALVVTIIVLLILAGISVQMLTGENGILTRAGEAKNNTETASAKEQIQIEVFGSYGTDGNLDMNVLKTNLEKIGATVNGENPLTVTLNEHTFKVDSKNIYELQYLNAQKIKNNAKLYYGSKVTGYTCVGTGVEIWRIFYADKDNIYLIADDYISKNDAPNGKEGTELDEHQRFECRLNFGNIYQDYSGSDWILENSKAKKWLNMYFNYTSDKGVNYPNKTSKNPNIKAVAFMMDTSNNVWGKWANPDLAEYAIGGPTLEMYVESYKDSHPESNISCSVTGTNGYTSSNSSGLEANDENNEIYIKSSNLKAAATWLAAPPSNSNNDIMYASYSGSLSGYYSTASGCGFRPIVCLKSKIQLEEVQEGEYKIK